MERTYINEAQKAIGGTVKVQGFIENLRNSKYMAFIVQMCIRDRDNTDSFASDDADCDADSCDSTEDDC